jgi:hypothetical protein
MDRKDAIAWMLSLCASLRLSQAKTLSHLAVAACQMARASIGELGRCLSGSCGVAVKHCIKRVDRFLSNGRIEPAEAMRGLVQWLAQPRKKLLILLDWVDIRSFPCIVLAARLKGRAVPLLWTVCRDGELYRSRNNLEYGLLKLLRTMVPDSTQVVVLADRGFGRAEMARECQKLGFDFLIRIRPDVYIRHDDFTGKLLDLPVGRGGSGVYRQVQYRKSHPVTANVAVVWLPQEEQPWFLLTSLPRLQGLKLTKLYARRMSIEEYFRDAKSLRNGFALRLTLVKDPRRLERLLLVLAVAYLLLVAIGLACSRMYRSGRWCSNNRSNECSLVSIGRFMLETFPGPLRSALLDLRREINGGNWG